MTVILFIPSVITVNVSDFISLSRSRQFEEVMELALIFISLSRSRQFEEVMELALIFISLSRSRQFEEVMELALILLSCFYDVAGLVAYVIIGTIVFSC
jgi:hypothetical protein